MHRYKNFIKRIETEHSKTLHLSLQCIIISIAYDNIHRKNYDMLGAIQLFSDIHNLSLLLKYVEIVRNWSYSYYIISLFYIMTSVMD